MLIAWSSLSALLAREATETLDFLEHIQATRQNDALQRRHAIQVEEVRKRGDVECPECGASGEALAWFWYETPRATWQNLAGRAGVMAWCDRHAAVVHFWVYRMS